jgi:hypothetical protein
VVTRTELQQRFDWIDGERSVDKGERERVVNGTCMGTSVELKRIEYGSWKGGLDDGILQQAGS